MKRKYGQEGHTEMTSINLRSDSGHSLHC